MVTETKAELPPGQFYGKKWIIYSALSEPFIRLEDWRLKTKGLVEKELNLSIADMQKLPQTKFTKTFSCLLPDTLVYANSEPKQIRDLAIGDSIIGRDGKRHKIKELVRKEHKGKIVGIKASYLPPCRMTPEHPVLTIKGEAGLGELKGHRRERTFRRPSDPNG
jgi:hypothetical protein